ncbi:MAG: ASCH domain-containing protein [Planctomycetota bacterium]
MKHLAVLKPRYIRSLLDGDKTLESRFSVNRIPPYEKVRVGDTIYFKQSGGPVCVMAEAGRVELHDKLEVEDIKRLISKHRKAIACDDDHWKRKAKAKYATLVWLTDVRPIDDVTPVPDIPKLFGRAWLVLDNQPIESLPA